MNAQNIDGNTPLHICYALNHRQIANMLQSQGSDPRITNRYGLVAQCGIMPVSDAVISKRLDTAGIQMVVGMPKRRRRRKKSAQEGTFYRKGRLVRGASSVAISAGIPISKIVCTSQVCAA